MKQKTILKTSLFLSLIAVLSSCSTSVEIVKRTFNDGYYVHVSTNKHPVVKHETAMRSAENNSNPVLKEEKVASSLAVNPQVVCEEASSKEVNSTAENQIVASLDRKPVVNVKRNHAFVPVVANANYPESNNIASEPNKQISSKKEIRKFIWHGLFHGAGVPTIVLILLCLFLPFIAVGLVDNWGTRFLISLLLTLLFWFPGVIYAFIVCFA